MMATPPARHIYGAMHARPGHMLCVCEGEPWCCDYLDGCFTWLAALTLEAQLTHHRALLALLCRFLPYVGMVTIIMNDYPMLKYGLIAVLAILVITSKE